MSQKSTRGRWVGLVAGLCVSAIALGLIAYRVDGQAVLEAIGRADPWWLLASLPLKGVALACMAARTRALMRPVAPTPLGAAWRSHLLGFVGNNLLPFRAGELARVGWLSRRVEAPAAAVLSTAALERLFDMLALLGIFAVVLPAALLQVSAELYVLGAVLGALVLGSLAVSRRPAWFVRVVGWGAGLAGARIGQAVTAQAERFALGLAGLSSPLSVLAALGATLAYWAVSMLGMSMWFLAFGLEVPWYAPLLVTVYLAFGTLLPSAPGFVGTYHLAVTTALVTLGVEEPTAVSVAIVGHFIATVPWTIGGAPFVGQQLRQVWRRADPQDEQGRGKP